MEHISKIMNGLRARFGEAPLKEGQDMKAVVRSWERALGQYAESDLLSVARHWADTTKYSRWPEVGEMIEIIKMWHLKPVQLAGDNRPADVIKAEREAGFWYGWLLDQVPPAIGITNAMILKAVLDDVYPAECNTKGPQSFAFQLTRAFMHGVLPDQWESRKEAYLKHCLDVRAKYKLACEKFGDARVNESNGEWLKWMNAA